MSGPRRRRTSATEPPGRRPGHGRERPARRTPADERVDEHRRARRRPRRRRVAPLGPRPPPAPRRRLAAPRGVLVGGRRCSCSGTSSRRTRSAVRPAGRRHGRPGRVDRRRDRRARASKGVIGSSCAFRIGDCCPRRADGAARGATRSTRTRPSPRCAPSSRRGRTSTRSTSVPASRCRGGQPRSTSCPGTPAAAFARVAASGAGALAVTRRRAPTTSRGSSAPGSTYVLPGESDDDHPAPTWCTASTGRPAPPG